MGLGPDLRLVVFDLDGTLLHLDVDWDRVRRLLGTDRTGETIGDAIRTGRQTQLEDWPLLDPPFEVGGRVAGEDLAPVHDGEAVA